jgi:hypothetical protein
MVEIPIKKLSSVDLSRHNHQMKAVLAGIYQNGWEK